MHIVINILVLSPLKEWSFNNTGVLLGWFEDRDSIISKVERYNKSSVNILWDFCVESSCVSENFLIVVYVFEEINFWFLGNKLVDITERINFISKTIMWWNLNYNWVSWFWLFDISKWEMSWMVWQIIILCKFINSADIEASTISYKWMIKLNFIACEISISNKLLTWLVHCECLR